jgi:predicted amidohydrolase
VSQSLVNCEGEICTDVSLTGIVPGTLVESHRDAEKDEDKLLNVCYFIDHEGSISGKYIKKNLWCVDSIPASPTHHT